MLDSGEIDLEREKCHVQFRGVVFGNKVGQISPKWDK